MAIQELGRTPEHRTGTCKLQPRGNLILKSTKGPSQLDFRCNNYYLQNQILPLHTVKANPTLIQTKHHVKVTGKLVPKSPAHKTSKVQQGRNIEQEHKNQNRQHMNINCPSIQLLKFSYVPTTVTFAVLPTSDVCIVQSGNKINEQNCTEFCFPPLSRYDVAMLFLKTLHMLQKHVQTSPKSN